MDKERGQHVVEEATWYQDGRWVPMTSAERIWEALRLCCIEVYIGTSDKMENDAEKNFLAELLRQNTDLSLMRKNTFLCRQLTQWDL